MEKEKTYNSQLDIEKEQSLRTNPIRFQDLLQSYSNQETVILAKKTYRPMEQHAEPRLDKGKTHYVTRSNFKKRNLKHPFNITVKITLKYVSSIYSLLTREFLQK